jgi:hypothetical protein
VDERLRKATKLYARRASVPHRDQRLRDVDERLRATIKRCARPLSLTLYPSALGRRTAARLARPRARSGDPAPLGQTTAYGTPAATS